MLQVVNLVCKSCINTSLCLMIKDTGCTVFPAFCVGVWSACWISCMGIQSGSCLACTSTTWIASMTGWCAPLPAPLVWSLWMLHFCPPMKPTELNHTLARTHAHTPSLPLRFWNYPIYRQRIGQSCFLKHYETVQHCSPGLSCWTGKPAGVAQVRFFTTTWQPRPFCCATPCTEKQKTFFFFLKCWKRQKGKTQLVFSPHFSRCNTLLFFPFSSFSSKGLSKFQLRWKKR